MDQVPARNEGHMDKAAEKLEATQEEIILAKAIFDLAAAGKAVIDVKSGRFVKVNRKFCQMLNYSEEELLKKSFSEITHPGDKIWQAEAFYESLKVGEPWSLEKRYLRKDGSILWVLVSGAIVHDKNGNPERVISTIFDISDKKEAEQRLHILQTITEVALSKRTSQRELLETIIDHVKVAFQADTIAILLADDQKEHLEIQAARGLERTTQGKTKIPIGKGFAGSIFLSGLSQRVDDLKSVELVSPVLSSSGIQCLIGSPLESATYRIGVINVGRLKANPFNDEDLLFLKLIADRIASALETAQLYESSQQTVRDLYKEKSLREQFVNTLTHDLRIPLSAINMSAQLLERTLAHSPAAADLIRRIKENVVRGDQLIQDLLDSNRVRAGEGMTVNIEKISIDEPVKSAVDNLRAIHGDRFNLVFKGNMEGYWCASGIRRITENLCTNAIKYGAPAGKVTVTIDALTDQVRLSVHNIGNPISPKDQRNLFSSFKRAKSAELSGKKGWGVGLTVVKGISEALCGEIAVRSNAEEGTVFEVILPRDSRPCHEQRASS